jgi:hypothetical protein
VRLYRRGDVWYCWFYENGKRVQRSTQCHDRRAAEARAREWERDVADPAHAAARKATLSDALKLLLRFDDEEIRAGRRSADTREFHEKKAGHLVRVFETNDQGERIGFPLVQLGAPEVDGYISRRRGEGAKDATVAKELSVLRKALRLAVRARLWRGRSTRSSRSRSRRRTSRGSGSSPRTSSRSSSPSSRRTTRRAPPSSSRRAPVGERPSSRAAATSPRTSRLSSCVGRSGRRVTAPSRW